MKDDAKQGGLEQMAQPEPGPTPHEARAADFVRKRAPTAKSTATPSPSATTPAQEQARKDGGEGDEDTYMDEDQD